MQSFPSYRSLLLVALFTFQEWRSFGNNDVDNFLSKNHSLPWKENLSNSIKHENFVQFGSKISRRVQTELYAELEKDPFQQWNYRSRWREMSDLKLNGELMSKAIQPGNPVRLKNVLIKAVKGQQINVAVIGGSNSAGGKLGTDEKSLDGLFFKVFADWWNKTIGKVTKSFMKSYEVTIGGTGSYFFAFCYKTFIPENQTIDLAFIDASINFNMRGKAEAFEQLTRQVLLYPSVPAILYVNLVSGLGVDPNTKKVVNPRCINLENFGQTKVARHYGITSFSLKEVLCRKEDDKWTVVVTNMAGSDGRHIGIKAHALISMLMIDYIREVFDQVLNDLSNGNITYHFAPLPELLLLKRDTEVLKQPLCWTRMTPNIFKDLHRPNIQIQITQKDGFSPYGSFRDERSSDGNTNTDLRTDAQGGWGTWRRYSSIKFRFYVPSVSSSYNTRSVIILTRTSGNGGKAEVRLDEEKNKTIYINTKSIYGQTRLDTVATRVKPGYHTITVRTVCKGNFLVSGVVVGPPDFERRKVI